MVWLSEPRYKQQLPLSDSGGSDASHEGQKLGKVVLTTLWGRAGLVLEAKLPPWGLPRLFCSSSLDEALAKLPNLTFSLERFHCRAAMIELKSQLAAQLVAKIPQEVIKRNIADILQRYFILAKMLDTYLQQLCTYYGLPTSI